MGGVVCGMWDEESEASGVQDCLRNSRRSLVAAGSASGGVLGVGRGLCCHGGACALLERESIASKGRGMISRYRDITSGRATKYSSVKQLQDYTVNLTI